jgi:ATP-binding cassette subfamily F protein uup
MPLLSLLDLHHAFGGAPVLDGVNLQVEAGERVCLVGRNGCGKSTLLRLIAGEMRPDEGSVFRSPGLRLARLSQEIPDDINGSIYDIVEGSALEAAETGSHEEDWERDLRIERLLERMGLAPRAEFAALSEIGRASCRERVYTSV